MTRSSAHGMQANASSLEITPIAAVVGAEVRCGSVRELDDQAIAAIRQGLLDHCVLVFRGQHITDPELIAFGKRLGELDFAPFTTTEKKRPHEEIIVVSNVKEDGVPIGVLGDAEVNWHSDNSYRDMPLSFSLLYAVECPPAQGETGFANMYLACETLAADIRSKVKSLVIKHDLTYLSDGSLRRGYQHATDPIVVPGPLHPIVRTHPDSGCNALYLGRRRNAYIPGLEFDESEALLNTLWAHATQERFAWHHAWRPGDIVIWDNRCLMHHRNPFDPAQRRVMHRLQFRGERPYHDPRAASKGPHPRSTQQAG
jgi:taurine dioxygenase